jgi:hypothetical protein
MEIYHRQGQHTRFTSARCDDPQDAQKVSSFYQDNMKIVLWELLTRGPHNSCCNANTWIMLAMDHYVSNVCYESN